MGARDFLLLMAVNLVWGLNIVATRWVVGVESVEPIFYAGLRFALLGLFLIPLLRPVPQQFGQLFLIAMFIGAGHFALLFLGLANAEASAAAVVGQLGVPFSTILSVIFLGERIQWRRGLGIVLAFAGVLMIAVKPGEMSLSLGLTFIAVSAFIGSVGGVMMKRIKPMPALRLQGWIGILSFVPLFGLSVLVEPNAIASWPVDSALVWLALAFSVFGVSMFGHSAFYVLLKRHDMSLIAPLTLMTPLWGVVFGILLLGEPLSARFLIGAAVSLSGVLIIALRSNRTLPKAALTDGSGGQP